VQKNPQVSGHFPADQNAGQLPVGRGQLPPDGFGNPVEMPDAALADFAQVDDPGRAFGVHAADDHAGDAVLASDHGFRVNEGRGGDNARDPVDFPADVRVIFHRAHVRRHFNV